MADNYDSIQVLSFKKKLKTVASEVLLQMTWTTHQSRGWSPHHSSPPQYTSHKLTTALTSKLIWLARQREIRELCAMEQTATTNASRHSSVGRHPFLFLQNAMAWFMNLYIKSLYLKGGFNSFKYFLSVLPLGMQVWQMWSKYRCFSELDLWNIRGTGLFPTSILTFNIKMGAATLIGKILIYFQFMNYLWFHSPLNFYKSIHVLTIFGRSQLFLPSTSDSFWQLEENCTAAPSGRTSSRLNPVTPRSCRTPARTVPQDRGSALASPPHEDRQARGHPCRNHPQ